MPRLQSGGVLIPYRDEDEHATVGFLAPVRNEPHEELPRRQGSPEQGGRRRPASDRLAAAALGKTLIEGGFARTFRRTTASPRVSVLLDRDRQRKQCQSKRRLHGDAHRSLLSGLQP